MSHVLANNPIDSRQNDEVHEIKEDISADQQELDEYDPWWRAFKLWKVDMRGLNDDKPS